MNSALIKRLRKIATLEAEDYGAEPQDHSSWQAADVIERQAAQIEMMREALTLIALDDCCTDPAPIAQKALSTTPDQALEQFAAKVRDQCDFECYKSNEYGFHRTYLDISNGIRAIKELPE